jgi:hypothetical protein
VEQYTKAAMKNVSHPRVLSTRRNRFILKFIYNVTLVAAKVGNNYEKRGLNGKLMLFTLFFLTLIQDFAFKIAIG